MTIRPGEPWGSIGPVPEDVIVVADDQQLRAAASERLHRGAPRRVPPLAPLSGDIWRSLGGRVGVDRVGAQRLEGGQVARLPFDGLRVELDGEVHWAFAHVVVRRSWWRGPLTAVMNVQYLGDWDVAPRAHPNDGQLDVVSVDPTLGLRARWQARTRLPSGTHLPHPLITSRRAPAVDLVFARPTPVRLDGELVGAHRRVVVSVVDDLLTVCI